MEKILNIEIKARLQNLELVRAILSDHEAHFKGLDHQIDTYYISNQGRLKLREGNIESALIFYERQNQAGPKQSDIILYKSDQLNTLKSILNKALPTLVIVDKKREIYYIDNVKFHIDVVEELGRFVEIEAIDEHGNIGKEKLLEQCQHFMDLFQIQQTDLLDLSYSDLLLEKLNNSEK